jgi:hypothetical protein
MRDKSEFLYCVFIVTASILAAVARRSFRAPGSDVSFHD